MGISRSSRYKRRLTGGRRNVHQKKRKGELGRPPAHTRLGEKKIHTVRCRGGNIKFRALRLESGNFAWGSECSARKARILDVVYNASNNELVRTKTLVKGAIVQIDATPFRQWYEQHYQAQLGKKVKETKKDDADGKAAPADAKKSARTIKKFKQRSDGHALDSALKDQFLAGRLYAKIASRPGQSGRCDGYILEEKELEFYVRKLQKKK